MKRATPKRKPPRAADELARALQAMIDDRKAAPRVSAKLAPILRVAADLHGMPDADFKARLKRELFGEKRSTALRQSSRSARSALAKERVEPMLAPKAETHEAPRRYEQPGNIMPFMYIEGVGRAFDFYRDVFGAREVHRAEEGGKLSHIQMAIGQTNVMLSDPTLEHVTKSPASAFATTPHSLGGTPLHLYVYVPDADAAYKRALDAGSKVVDPMEDKVWGDHCGGVQDPFGHVWFIATPIKDRPAASQ
jgi:PhnB protein